MPARTYLIAAPALLALNTLAAMADGPVGARVPTSAAVWTGAYAGGHFGWAWGSSDWRSDTAGDTATASGSINLYNGYNLSAGTGSFLAGLQAGYNVMAAPGVLIGVHVDATAPNRIGGTSPLHSATAGSATLDERVEWGGTVRGRVGFFHGPWLLYGTGGWAWSWDRLDRTQLGQSNLPGGAQPGDGQSARVFHSGWVAGGGVELPVGGSWTAALEYLYSDLGRQSATFQGGAQRISTDFVEQSIRFGLNYHLGGDREGTLSVAAGNTRSPSYDFSNWSIHGQTTYVHQYAAPFRAPYRGTNSLVPGQARETWDATAYVGYKPWQGGEIWFNPEIDQGFGLANTLGVAGFTSGEAYKLGAAYPYARVPRFFLRQTVDLGGKSEEVEAGINQFAGRRTSDRLVLTVGKLAAADIFDANKFAHDPRADFLNWSLLDTGSFDYAADAWGYAYGAAAELVLGRWTYRAGFFDLSKVPNSTLLDTSFRQHQLLAEIERRHELWGQPGKLALTGFLTHGRMGNFNDAIRAAAFTGSPADIASVRRFNDRPGIATNFEQNITADIGVFVRAGISNGKLETYEFTDIDRTIAGGVSIGGKLWGRKDDTIGIAGVVNAISGTHQKFLNAGGLGILVGDDRLPHPSTERILETYYSLAVSHWRLTLDYQLIINPAYNTDRGPVSVFSTRLHSQF